MRSWLWRQRFPLSISAVLVGIEVFFYILLKTNGLHGTRWLGDMSMVPTDQAVYLNYIEQIRQGSWVVHNFFAPVSPDIILHPAYYILGLAARFTGASAITVHEVARWVVTVCVVFLLHAISRALTKTERDAAWASGAVMLAGGFGWVYLIWRFLRGAMRVTELIPDVKGEAFFFPTLLWGVHVILVWALLPYCLYLIDRVLRHPRKKMLWVASVITAFLIFIFPYVSPLVCLYAATMACVIHRKKIGDSIRSALPFVTATLIGLAPHVWNQLSTPSRHYLFLQNDLPIEPVVAWALAFIPWVALCLWRWKKKIVLREDEQWLVAWLLCVIVVILLPFKWDRKLTEGLSGSFVWLGLPVLFLIRDWLKKELGTVGLVAASCVMLMSPVRLILFQLDWTLDHTTDHARLYIPEDIDRAWAWIRTTSGPDAVVLTDDPWVGLWTPLNAGRHVFAGHEYESLDFIAEHEMQKEIFNISPTSSVAALVQSSDVDTMLVSVAGHEARLDEALRGTSWHVSSRFGDVTVWQR